MTERNSKGLGLPPLTSRVVVRPLVCSHFVALIFDCLILTVPGLNRWLQRRYIVSLRKREAKKFDLQDCKRRHGIIFVKGFLGPAPPLHRR